MKKIFLLFVVLNIAIAGDIDKFKIRENIISGIVSENEKREKSPAVAFGFSLIVPGLGQAYLERFDVGKYFLASEISLWLVYFGLNEYGRWLNDDAINFAVIRAGIDPNGKPDDFFANIENYRSVYDYNLRKGRDRDYAKLYDPEKFYWWWDSEQSRQRYKDMRIKSRAFGYYAKFSFVFIIANHFASAIDALILARKQSKSLNHEFGFIPSSRGLNFYLKFEF
ncbi:hypothetical protein JGI7_00709 [Candidatus Kryptonium thompsonii]|uniref:DUF5683 domain-containing protein n=1 Tax=Candidatus Kryptonium thompsonii TaxID=1633631 RepID=A0A0P1LRH9_9BACT|nr:hypothetical protein [Candidatus Kryptonium thompsoni]CUS78634.1 hypothetical protein JGI16_10137 [Candidatus Kryptonium thompsoni]CUS78979.1 hypothetical protein JGI14_100522 [Candidatus Kryptonium thompsoni]CUS82089.1 hypothetical protein JGI8_00566 [Candidatus Kryptonium thompsoni]CUS83464.1 hypothetical protein JGI7_00709 [Candidatus Kryptonium thompsoni]CUS84457.1 hypothetical protein JGI15_102116 [Candidatus Kryptonium thompsoni]